MSARPKTKCNLPFCVKSGAALLLCSYAAHAQVTEPWGDAAGCTIAAGGQVQTDSIFLLLPDRVQRYESTCLITEIDGDIMTQRAVIHTQCNGEGSTWDEVYASTPVGEDLAIWPVDSPDFVTELRQCQ